MTHCHVGLPTGGKLSLLRKTPGNPAVFWVERPRELGLRCTPQLRRGRRPRARGWQFSPAFKGVLMQKCVWVALALVAVIGYSVNQAEGRGGRGGGGGPRGGGFRPGGNFGGGQNLGGQKLGGANLQNGAIRDNLGNGQWGKTQGLFGQNLQTAKSNAVGAAQGKASQLKTNFSSKNEPFTPAWYADHPRCLAVHASARRRLGRCDSRRNGCLAGPRCRIRRRRRGHLLHQRRWHDGRRWFDR